MKKIMREEANFEYVEKGTKLAPVFIAEDGKEFKGYNAEWLCEEYEKASRKKSLWEAIEKRKVSLPDIWEWFHPKTNDELLVVLFHMGMDDGYDYVFVDDEKIQPANLKDYVNVGDWIGYDYHDGGDSRGSHNVYTLDYVKKSIQFIYELN